MFDTERGAFLLVSESDNEISDGGRTERVTTEKTDVKILNH